MPGDWLAGRPGTHGSVASMALAVRAEGGDSNAGSTTEYSVHSMEYGVVIEETQLHEGSEGTSLKYE